MDAAWVNGLGIIRGLGRVGLKSLALSHSPRGIGRTSRYAVGVQCPDPAQEPARLVDFLLAMGQQLPHKGVLLITDDSYLLALARAHEQLRQDYYLTFPEFQALAPIMDKLHQHQMAVQCGVPVPSTVFLHQESDVFRWPNERYPALIKGRLGKGFQRAHGHQVLLVQNQGELLQSYHRYGQHGLVLQEIIPGDDDQLYTLGAYISPSGQLLAAFTGRKLQQSPPGFGTCRLGESLDNPTVKDLGVALLKALKFHGVAQVEFKLDPRDGRFKLIEINARFWLWHGLATQCGVNLASIAYLDAVGRTPNPILAQQCGPVWVLLADYLRHSGGAGLAKRLGWRDWARRLLPNSAGRPVVDGVISLRDPLPTLAMIRREAVHLLGQRVKPRRGTRADTLPTDKGNGGPGATLVGEPTEVRDHVLPVDR
jgi:predicted ATP-grasp superfamily ATP-dependent carboligase